MGLFFARGRRPARKNGLLPKAVCGHGAEDRNRTGTKLTLRGILSPLRLPVPPPRQDGIKPPLPGAGVSMEAAPRIELGIKVLQTSALPLGYAAIVERKTGLEPATPTLARWCSTTELLPHMATRIRFELTISAVTGRHVRPLHHRAARYFNSIPMRNRFVKRFPSAERNFRPISVPNPSLTVCKYITGRAV